MRYRSDRNHSAASVRMGGNRLYYGYALTMTQEADRSPAQAGAGAGGAPAQPAAAPGSGQPHATGQRRGTGHGTSRTRDGARAPRKPQGRPSLGGGTPAQDRELRAQGRETVRKLLEAGMIEFEERGFGGVRVDDVVQRAGISHGTFYLYFSNKEDLFNALLRDALHDMEIVAGDFPVATSDQTGLNVLRRWVRKFFSAYATHATIIRILSSADLVPEEVYGDGLRLFFSIAEAMTTGMTAAAEAAGRHQEHSELTAVACLMMLERVNYLISTDVQLPVEEMSDRIADIMFAAFGLTVA
jgi:AcrR family transcriptional regulator